MMALPGRSRLWPHPTRGRRVSDDTKAQDALRALLTDSFERVRELVSSVTDGLSRDESTYRPDEQANSIGWLVWHLTRVQDDHMSDLAGTEQVWTSGGWHERCALPFDSDATGFAHTSGEVADVVVDAGLLDQYHAAVHQSCLEYVKALTPAELDKVVDDAWDPPVTAAVRLVSILGDCLQHVGQAAYLRPIAHRAITGTSDG
jgi:hypothetical protein